MNSKFFILVLVASLFLSLDAFAARSQTSKIKNAGVVGSNYTFDIYALSTGTNGVNVSICSFWLDVDQTGGFDFVVAPVLSNVNVKYTGVTGVDDYDAMAVQWFTVGIIKKVGVTIYFTGANTGLAGVLSNTGPDGERICTVTLKISNATKTASLTWDPSNSSILNNPNTLIVGQTFSGSDNSLLPVELTSFTASAHGRSVTLAWATATEIKNSGFQIERKALDAKKGEWQKVAFINGHGTTNAAQSYGYTDALQVAGKYSYRLKQIDADGKFEYSKEVEAAIALQAQDYALSSNYPNPFNPTTSFHFAVKKAGNVSVTIFNTIGQEVRSLFNDVAQADVMYDLTFDGASLASGTYFYVLKTADRFEVKKMLMMK